MVTTLDMLIKNNVPQFNNRVLCGVPEVPSLTGQAVAKEDTLTSLVCKLAHMQLLWYEHIGRTTEDTEVGDVRFHS